MEKYRLHYTHPDGRIIGDVMPYYYQGQYHVYYLLNGSGHNDINHEHAVSTDLIHWKNVPPSIRHEDNCAFTGCYLTTPDGLHHCFFTRWNPENKDGRESIGHATSHNLIDWEKTDLHLVPDGKIYSSARYRDFRDPCVFFDNRDHLYHMFLLANATSKENTATSWDENWVQGHYISSDLKVWTPLPPLLGSFADECPDYLFENGTHYIHGCHHYAIAPSFVGPYESAQEFVLDSGLRAAKMCAADHRKLWFGGFIGGSFTLPRELVIRPNNKLGLTMAKEILQATSAIISSKKGKKIVLEISPTQAHRIHLDIPRSSLADVVIHLENAEERAMLSVQKNRIALQIGSEEKWLDTLEDNDKVLLDIVIDFDLAEVYWNGVGARTIKINHPIEKIKVLSKDTPIALTHFGS